MQKVSYRSNATIWEVGDKDLFENYKSSACFADVLGVGSVSMLETMSL